MRKSLANKLQHLSDQNVMEMDKAKEKAHPIIGFYCLYSPTEIAVAAKAIPVSLCGTRNDPINAVEEILPRNLCPLIKSSFGFAKTDTCPFFRFSDLIIGDTTCDGKKKMFELLSRYKTTHVLQLPQEQNSLKGKAFWRAELEKFKSLVEKHVDKPITQSDLKNAIRLMNRKRRAKKALMDLNQAIPAPLKGSELLDILFRMGFLADLAKGIDLLEEIVAQLKKESFAHPSPIKSRAKRILLTGVPVGIGCEKVVTIVEQSKADLVAFENCSGYKQAFQVDENMAPLDALAKQYLATPCSVMSPNQKRFDLLKQMIRDFSIDGVIDLTWQACHTYNIEAFQINEMIQENFGFPCLHLETDYAKSDTEQLRVRIQAYLEML